MHPEKRVSSWLSPLCWLLLATLPVAAQAEEKPAAAPAAAPAGESPSYGSGLMVGQSLHLNGITTELDIDAFVRGLKDALGGKVPTAEDTQRVQQFVTGIRDAVGGRNKEAARAFLEKNGKQKGVVTTASGLQYKIIAAGDAKAASPGPTDQVTVQYRGKLLDGTEFDSSYKRGQPATFAANGVIKGWQEALVLMKPGAKWELFIPPDLAYDMKPPPRSVIPLGAALVFDVELLSVNKPPAK